MWKKWCHIIEQWSSIYILVAHIWNRLQALSLHFWTGQPTLASFNLKMLSTMVLISGRWHKSLRLLSTFEYKVSTYSWLLQKKTCKTGMFRFSRHFTTIDVLKCDRGSIETFYRFTKWRLPPGSLHSQRHWAIDAIFQDIHCKPFPGNHGDRSNNGHIPSIISTTAQISILQSKVALQSTSLFFK